jgi:hypothetical protein
MSTYIQVNPQVDMKDSDVYTSNQGESVLQPSYQDLSSFNTIDYNKAKIKKNSDLPPSRAYSETNKEL